MIQVIVYTVMLLSLGCLAFGYWPQLIPGLLWLYATFARERAERLASRLLGRWREHRHGAKCFTCGRRVAVWVGKGWFPLCDVHHRELMEVRSTYTENPVSD
jgi:hypothetical protein